jgi:hypothetical protein
VLSVDKKQKGVAGSKEMKQQIMCIVTTKFYNF